MTEITGVKVLYFLRERGATTWNALSDWFKLPTAYRHSHLRNVLDQLYSLGFIEFDATSGQGKVEGEIRLTAKWRTMQDVLGLSLKKAVEEPDPRAMVVVPTLGKPQGALPNLPNLFVLMPFLPSLRGVYEDHITTVALKLGLKVARADDFFNSHFIMADIWEAICGAQLIIADCTGRNANVFYEIGLAHAVGKSVVLITQNTEDIPFDLTYLRHIKYEYTPPGMRQFEAILTQHLEHHRGRRFTNEKDVSVYRGLEMLRGSIERDERLRQSIEKGIKMLEAGIRCPKCRAVGGSNDFRLVPGVPFFVCNKCGTKTYG
jgi:hypothetical protein